MARPRRQTPASRYFRWKKFRLHLLSLSLLIVFQIAVQLVAQTNAPDITGRWTGIAETTDEAGTKRQENQPLDIRMEEGKLTGNRIDKMGKPGLKLDVQQAGPKVNVYVYLDFEGGEPLLWKLELKDGNLTGTFRRSITIPQSGFTTEPETSQCPGNEALLVGCRRQVSGYDLRHIQHGDRPVRYRAERVLKHASAKGARGGDCIGAGLGKFLYAIYIHALAFFFAEEHHAAAGSATERFFARSRRFNQICAQQ